MKNTWWVDFQVHGARYRKRSPENSRAGASAFEAVMRHELAQGRSLEAPPGSELVARFATRWLSTEVASNNKPSEQETKRLILRVHLLPYFGSCKLSEVTVALVEKFKADQLAKGLNPKTVNNHLAVIGRLLTVAEEWEALPRRPRIKLIRTPPSPFDYLSSGEASLLLRSIDDTLLRGGVLLALRTGLRLGELRGLDWTAVDLRRRVVVVRQAIVRRQLVSPKSNRVRSVPLSREIGQALSQWPHRSGLLLSRDGGVTPCDPDVLRRDLRRSCKKAGLRRVGWHTLRHSFASQLVAQGVNMRIVQELLGHSDIRVTLRYSHVEPAQLLSAVELLDEQLEPSSPPREGPESD